MIHADFVKADGKFISFTVKGHAEYDNYGQDIVCASVTSAVQLTANAITEILSVAAKVIVDENEIIVILTPDCDERCYLFMEALHLHLVVFSEDYKGTIEVLVKEEKSV